jgi:hypothetical protein
MYTPLSVRSEPQDEGMNSPAARAVLLKHQGKSVCASGVLFDEDSVLTTLHFVRSACDDLECAGLEVLRAATVGAQASIPVSGPFHIIFQSALLDLAVLTRDANQVVDFATLLPGDVDQESPTLKMYGFPGCRTLSQRTLIMQNTLPFHMYLQGDALPGSSGSFIQSSSGAIVALLNQAEAGTVQSLFTKLGAKPSGLRASRLAALNGYQDFARSRDSIAEGLIQSFEVRVRSSGTGITRLLRSLEWQDLLMRFDQDQERFAQREFFAVFPSGRDAFVGTSSSRDAHDLFLIQTLRDLSITERFGSTTLEVDYIGTQHSAAQYLGIGLLILVSLTALWSLSLTWLYFTSPRQGIARLFELLFAALFLWPLGLVVAWFMRGGTSVKTL